MGIHNSVNECELGFNVSLTTRSGKWDLWLKVSLERLSKSTPG